MDGWGIDRPGELCLSIAAFYFCSLCIGELVVEQEKTSEGKKKGERVA